MRDSTYRSARARLTLAALASFAACDLTTYPAQSDFEAAYFYESVDFPPSLLRIRLGEGASRRELTSDDLIYQWGAYPRTPRITLPGSGTMPVRVSLVAAGVDTLASGAFVLELRKDYHYSLGIHPGGERRTDLCNIETVAVPLRRIGNAEALDGDTLFLNYGGQAPIPTC